MLTAFSLGSNCNCSTQRRTSDAEAGGARCAQARTRPLGHLSPTRWQWATKTYTSAAWNRLLGNPKMKQSNRIKCLKRLVGEGQAVKFSPSSAMVKEAILQSYPVLQQRNQLLVKRRGQWTLSLKGHRELHNGETSKLRSVRRACPKTGKYLSAGPEAVTQQHLGFCQVNSLSKSPGPPGPHTCPPAQVESSTCPRSTIASIHITRMYMCTHSQAPKFHPSQPLSK